MELQSKFLTLILLVFISFFAGIVDSIAGGGGLITLPSLLFFGISPTFALGTSKFIGACSGIVATINFSRSKLIFWRLFFITIPFSLLGGFVGSKTILFFDPEIIQTLIFILLPLVFVACFKKTKKFNENFLAKIEKTDKISKELIFLVFSIGFYDGFFGPGAGTLLALGMHRLLCLDLVSASALAKPFNVVSTVVSLAVFAFYDKILWKLAIIMAAASMLGSNIGSYLVIHRGKTFVKKTLLFVCVFLFLSLAIRINPNYLISKFLYYRDFLLK